MELKRIKLGVEVHRCDECISAEYRKGYIDGINDFAEKFRNRIDTGFTEYSTALTFSQMGIHRMILDILEELEG